MKKGRISKEEDEYIRANLDTMTAVEMAEKMDRNPDSVADYVKRKYSVGATKEEAAAYSLEDRPYYIELRQQFTGEELELFKYHWSRIVGQFNSDVFPTEELQIIDVIRLEMLMNRCLKSNKDNIEAIGRLEREINGAIESADPDDLERVMNMERQVGALRASQESLNRDYRDLQTKKSSMLKEMKGTREQRIKRLEDSRESFPAWIASLLSNPERLLQYGIDMEKMRLAMNGEKGRLSKYHKYDDGAVDQPFLNHESVLE